ncbi:MAG: AAA family ATPase, partial [Planctomycetota bacterium]|nr:AAA family ATPase [Planctomycetota bacterium]
FTGRARGQGIPMPQGLLLLGVQGCGKSLTARATARLLSFPLVRLDVANLLSSDRGTSERNLRDVLRLMETIAPAVLWLDEIEKGFAGLGNESDKSQDAVMARLFGSFLTWMENRKQPVFVVATANSVANLPPEMLRRGRFDELFFVDLPNFHERRDILGIHLSKRGWKPDKYDIHNLANRTEGFSGAELEQIVVAAMIDAFGNGRVLAQEDLERSREQTVPLSVTMEERVFALREWASSRCRRATLDSRVTQMIEDEQRQAALAPVIDDDEPVEPWQDLAEHGQINAGIVEYLRRNDTATFATIHEKFAKYPPVDGDLGLALRSDPNVVLWTGMSQELAETLAGLIANRRVYVHPISVDAYKSAAKSVKLPLRTELTDERSPRPMWFPAALRLLPAPGGAAGRFGRVTRIKLQQK